MLPIAAFYNSQCGVSVNILAEITAHKNPRVRHRCCRMLTCFLLCLPDRYDHQQRLLPYALSFVNDSDSVIQTIALECIEKCGFQYERDHPDDVIERRQLGVDGEDTIDYNNDLPNPFTQRPSLGARLFVRNNTSRFFLTVLAEHSSWREETRKRSAELLLILVVYCEEHLTKDFQHSIKAVAKAIEVEKMSAFENDRMRIMEKIHQILLLMAKYVDPTAYLPLVCPRISGDNSSATSNAEDGSHSEKARSSFAIILSSLVKSAPLHRIIPHVAALSSLLTSTNCIGPYAGTQTMAESLNAFLILIGRVVSGRDMKVFITHLGCTCNQSKVRSVLLTCKEDLIQFINTSDVGSNVNVAQDCIQNLSKLISAIDEIIESNSSHSA